VSRDAAWLRLYSRIVDDEKMRLLAFEDRWHFVALLCLKNEGLIDEEQSDLRQRKIAVRLGVQIRELDEIARRLREVGLIDEDLQPYAWDDLQFVSDSSSDRVRKFREKQRLAREKRSMKRSGNVSVTAQEAETETETDSSSNEDSSSGDEPELRPEHVFQFYQELAASIGRPVPRDFTPERRQLVRGRIAQYPLDDFKAVFAKCRDSPFLRGDRGRTPLTFDWLMQKKNFQKTLEGNFDG
jgi:hypothetical protein